MLVTPEPRRQHHDIDRREDADRRRRNTGKAGHQISDKRDADQSWARCDHHHRHRIEKLLLRQPAEVAHDALFQERDRGQATTEGECACLGEKQQDLQQ